MTLNYEYDVTIGVIKAFGAGQIHAGKKRKKLRKKEMDQNHLFSFLFESR